MSLYDPTAARERLQSITSDPDLLAAFDGMTASANAGDAEAFDDPARVSRWNDTMGSFLAHVMRRRISLDFVIGGAGDPFMKELAS